MTIQEESNETHRTYRRWYCRTCNSNIALIPKLRSLVIRFPTSVPTKESKKLIEELGIPYYGISSGKLRRYFDLKNFSDPFRVLKGFSQARKILKELKPDVVFLKAVSLRFPL